MNKSSKYMMGNAEIIAFIIGVLLMIAAYSAFFSRDFEGTELIRLVISVCIVVLFASLFGPLTGALTGFLGIVSALAVIGAPITFVDPFSYAVLGIIVGQAASRFLIREGQFAKKQMIVWNLAHMIGLISSFVFIRPELDYIIYNRDLLVGISIGIRVFFICAIPGGILLTLLFCGTSKFLKSKVS